MASRRGPSHEQRQRARGRTKTYEIFDERFTCVPLPSGRYRIDSDRRGEGITHAERVGSQWVTTGYPGKLWRSMEQALHWWVLQDAPQ